MINFTDTLVLAGMFLLRLAVPLAIVLGVAYFLKRLDRRWEAEARAEQLPDTVQPATQPVAEPAKVPAQPARRPGVDIPGPQLPYDPSRKPVWVAQGQTASGASRPCWEVKGCEEADMAHCPAVAHPEMPCWQARTRADRQMPEECFGCDVFKLYPRL